VGVRAEAIGREGKAVRHRRRRLAVVGWDVEVCVRMVRYLGTLLATGTNRRAIGRTGAGKWAAAACDLSQIKHFSVQARYSASLSPGTVRTRLRLDTSSLDAC
jgi:hypothetical protein